MSPSYIPGYHRRHLVIVQVITGWAASPLSGAVLGFMAPLCGPGVVRSFRRGESAPRCPSVSLSYFAVFICLLLGSTGVWESNRSLPATLQEWSQMMNLQTPLTLWNSKITEELQSMKLTFWNPFFLSWMVLKWGVFSSRTLSEVHVWMLYTVFGFFWILLSKPRNCTIIK